MNLKKKINSYFKNLNNKNALSASNLWDFVIVLATAFLSVYTFSYGGFPFVAIFFYPWIITLFFKKKIVINRDKFLLISLAIFSSIVLLSTIVAKNLNKREILILGLSLQYLLWILVIDFRKFEKYLYTLGVITAFIILILFIYKGLPLKISTLIKYRMWGEELPGWPNVIVLPLVFAFYISFKRREHIAYRIILAVAIIFTTSRSGLLGIFLITLYFILSRSERPILMGLILFSIGAVCLYIVYTSSYSPRLMQAGDRLEIQGHVVDLVSLKPWLGYGGHTMKNMTDPAISVWGHTHSWVLEMLLRYGSLGLISFTVVLLAVSAQIKNKDDKIMFIIFLILSLFQIYMRAFIGIIMVMYFLSNTPSAYVDKSLFKERIYYESE